MVVDASGNKHARDGKFAGHVRSGSGQIGGLSDGDPLVSVDAYSVGDALGVSSHFVSESVSVFDGGVTGGGLVRRSQYDEAFDRVASLSHEFSDRYGERGSRSSWSSAEDIHASMAEMARIARENGDIPEGMSVAVGVSERNVFPKFKADIVVEGVTLGRKYQDEYAGGAYTDEYSRMRAMFAHWEDTLLDDEGHKDVATSLNEVSEAYSRFQSKGFSVDEADEFVWASEYEKRNAEDARLLGFYRASVESRGESFEEYVDVDPRDVIEERDRSKRALDESLSTGSSGIERSELMRDEGDALARVEAVRHYVRAEARRAADAAGMPLNAYLDYWEGDALVENEFVEYTVDDASEANEQFGEIADRLKWAQRARVLGIAE